MLSGPAFVPGAFVILTTDPGRSGVVQAGEKRLAGRRMVPVRFANGSVKWLPAESLELVPETLPDVIERFGEGRFVGPEWLRRALTRIRVTARLADVVYSMEATETDFHAFQFKPVLKLLNSPTDALLIADEVGLGKTIEAGLIWTELRARLESNRLLVICPKTLCEKWRNELERRFGVDAQIVDARKLSRLLWDGRRGGRGFAAIAGMQSLRPPKGWDVPDDREPAVRENARRVLAQRLRDESDDEPLIDMLVVDEAHHMRNPKTLLHRLGELLNAVSTHRVFLSATPIHLRNRDLHSLLRLIDPETFEYENTLDEMIQSNEPIVMMRDLLMRSSASREDIVGHIDDAVRRFVSLADSKALHLLLKDMKERPLDGTLRSEFASRLETTNQMANYVTRTRRRDVKELRVVREAKAPVLEMRSQERRFYDAVVSEVEKYANEHDVNARFLLSTPLRLLTSSPAAASGYWAGLENAGQERIEETDDDSNPAEERPLLARLKVVARELGVTADLQTVDTKFDLLQRQLHQCWRSEPDAKIIVFSSFKPTLHYLKRRLEADGVACELIHGSVNEPRQEIIDRFREDPEVRMLLSSEVGAEGVDLQFCWIVINYDLPWNPMRLEQRIGRVDRLGQERPKVTVLNLVFEHTIDAIIYQRLYERLGLVERALGEFETVLGAPIREMALKLLDPELNEQQRMEVVDQTAIAVERRRQEEEELEKNAGALIQHGDYILQKITESRARHRWVSGRDVLVYVKDRLYRSFPGCKIESSPAGSDTYRITLSQAAQAALTGFVNTRKLQGATRLLNGDGEQRYRFVSSVVQRREPRVENISQLHPLVRFAVELDARDPEVVDAQPVAASVDRSDLEFECAPGIYVVGVRREEISVAGGRTDGNARISHAGARLNDREMLTAETAENFVDVVARHGRLLPNFAHDERLVEATALLRDLIVPELDRLYESFLERTTAAIDDRAAIRERALGRHRETKAAGLRRQHDRHRDNAVAARAGGDQRRFKQLMALASATEGRMRKLRDRIDMRLKQIEEQRKSTPEWSDVACVLIEVTP